MFSLTKPLTEQAIIFLYRSDILCPSPYEKQKPENLIAYEDRLDELYKNRRLRGIRYTLTAPGRMILRAIYMLGVSTLIAPISITYHMTYIAWNTVKISSKILIYKLNLTQTSSYDYSKKVWKLKDKINNHFDIFKKDSLLPFSLIGAIVLPILFVRTLNLYFLVAAVSSLSYNIYCTFYPVIDPCKSACQSKLMDENELLGKWELGVKAKKLPSISNMIENRFEKLVESIRELQQALPSDLKMKDYFHQEDSISLIDQKSIKNEKKLKYNDSLKTYILDWIAEHETILKQRNEWGKVEPLQNKILNTFDQYLKACQFLEFKLKLGKEKTINPFGLSKNESSKGLSVRMRDSMVEPFSLYLFKKMCQFDLFYPKKYAAIRTPSSESLSTVILNRSIFKERIKIAPISFYSLHKVKSFCAKGLAFFTITWIGAPAGILYHGFQSGKLYAQTKLQNKNNYLNQQKIALHIQAIYKDAACFLSCGHVISPKKILDSIGDHPETFKYTFAVLSSGLFVANSYIPLRRIAVITAITSLGISILLPFFAAKYSAKNLISSYAEKDERSELFKAIQMRNKFGYLTQEGTLLPYKKTDPQKFDEDLFRLMLKTSGEFLEYLREIKDFSGVKDILSMSVSDKSIDLLKMTKQLQALKNKDINIDECLKLISEYKETKKLISECARMTENFLEEMADYDYFPFSKKEIEQILGMSFDPRRKEAKGTGILGYEKWNLFIIQEIKILSEIKLSTNSRDINQKYVDFQNHFKELINKEILPSPYEILNLDSTANEITIKDQYKSFARIVHPDKVPLSNHKEADIYFKIIKAAADLLIEKL